MIVIQIVLIVALIMLALRFLTFHNTSHTRAWKKLVLMVFVFAAILAVLWPESMNWLARAVGVGRGADLLLYALVIAFIYQQLSGYLKGQEENRRIVMLARKVAILEANHKSHNAK